MKSAPHLVPVELARLYLKMTDFAKALCELEPLLADARSNQDWVTYLQAVPLLLRIYAEQMRFADIKSLVDDLENLKSQTHLEWTAEFYYTLGICDAYAGRRVSAKKHFELAHEFASASQDQKWLAHAGTGLTLCLCHNGELKAALEQAQHVRLLLQDQDLMDLEVSLELTLALIYREMEQFELGFAALERAQKKLLIDGNWYMKINVIYTLGTLYQKMGGRERAELHFRLARSMVDDRQLKHLSNQIDLRLLELRQSQDLRFDLVISKQPRFLVKERTKGLIDFRKQLVLFELLTLFMEEPGRVFSKEELVVYIWKENYNPLVHDNKLYVTLRRLRKLIEVDGCKPQYILRARNGYYFNSEMRVFQEST